MKKTLLIPLLAAAALAAPASALGWWGHHPHAVLAARLSGTGTSFGGATATSTGTILAGSQIGTGTYGASFSTTWSGAKTRTLENGATVACAPSNATVVLHENGSATDTATGSLTGRACTFTKADGTVVRAYMGSGSVTGAGSLAKTSSVERALFVEHADGTVKGHVVVGGPPVQTKAKRLHAGDHDDY